MGIVTKALRRVKRGLVFLWKDSPLRIDVDVSGCCNIHCKFCVLDSAYPNKGMMTLETFEKLAREIRDVPEVWLSNNCEPTLNKALPQMIRILKNNNTKVCVGFTTNGTLLNSSLSNMLIDSRLDTIQISFDGITKETFESIRRGANLYEVKENILKLINMKKKKGSSTPQIELVFTSLRKNIQELPQIIAWAGSVGISAVFVNGLEPYSEELEKEKLWNYNREPDESRQLFEQAAALARRNGVQLFLPRLTPKHFKRCLLINAVISWNGDVSPCCPRSFARKVYFDDYVIERPYLTFGNITDQSFNDIWYSKPYVKFRHQLMFGRLPESCKKCVGKEGVICPPRR